MRQKNILKILTDSTKPFFDSASNDTKTGVDILCNVLEEYKRLKKSTVLDFTVKNLN